MPKPELTDRQRDALAIIRGRIEGGKRPPTLQEIGDALGIRAQTAASHVQALEDKGYIRRVPHSGRSIELTEAT